VTGLPAAGKTTLGRSLSLALGLPLLSKDVVKESLFDTLGVVDRPWSLKLGAAASEILWSLLPGCPAGAVLDLWLDPRRDVGLAQRGLARAGVTTACEILCDCPGEIAAGRYAKRTRHPGHLQPDGATLQRIRESGPLMVPLGVGPALRVRTTGPVDILGVVAWLRANALPPG
jgi:glucokinase